MNLPEDLLYTKEHEWLRLDADGKTATVGITDFAQSQLGDIVFVELRAGETVEQDAVFGTVEAVKTVSELYAPVAGTVTEVNTDLDANPQYVNEDPYGKGWMVKLELSDPSQLEALLKADAYAQLAG